MNNEVKVEIYPDELTYNLITKGYHIEIDKPTEKQRKNRELGSINVWWIGNNG